MIVLLFLLSLSSNGLFHWKLIMDCCYWWRYCTASFGSSSPSFLQRMQKQCETKMIGHELSHAQLTQRQNSIWRGYLGQTLCRIRISANEFQLFESKRNFLMKCTCSLRELEHVQCSLFTLSTIKAIIDDVLKKKGTQVLDSHWYRCLSLWVVSSVP